MAKAKHGPRRLRTWAWLLALAAVLVAAADVGLMEYGRRLRAVRPEAYIDEAERLLNQGNFPGALSVWLEAEARGPEDPRVYKVLGDIHHRKGDWAEAVPAYQQALALGSDSTGVRLNLLTAYLELGQYGQAIEHGLRFIKEGNKDPFLYRYVAYAYYWDGRHAEAIPHFEAALKGIPNDLDLMHPLVICYRTVGRDDLADALGKEIRAVERRLYSGSGPSPR